MCQNKFTADESYELSKRVAKEMGCFDKISEIKINENEIVSCSNWIASKIENEKHLIIMSPSENNKSQCEPKLYVKEDDSDKWEFRG